jgi:hypothetical protein
MVKRKPPGSHVAAHMLHASQCTVKNFRTVVSPCLWMAHASQGTAQTRIVTSLRHHRALPMCQQSCLPRQKLHLWVVYCVCLRTSCIPFMFLRLWGARCVCAHPLICLCLWGVCWVVSPLMCRPSRKHTCGRFISRYSQMCAQQWQSPTPGPASVLASAKYSCQKSPRTVAGEGVCTGYGISESQCYGAVNPSESRIKFVGVPLCMPSCIIMITCMHICTYV